ncbi:tRNA-dihydrouridine synthase [Candidatus Falkowbacteria bacterium]|uniref:tRNA-dihydrouridine synthase n=1 Tax=Candidatus Buchananbacteria bacterium CG10_big_fil_rev_8_21_14_0_10_33_19 TaxID=1974525 RepID=A0A2H0W495_9BACT|nr:tRNA-dihydrouridine synthase [Candidatus Falkowbacteria bacterium]PIS06134.1 MAG: tRNA-dihydrouridine synthase [Candidatus Buchananbacteria bacterium CG10_big_fil_rev_8_21_14_0_10_33_19]
MKNFWTKLPKPFFVLAPMAEVTDAAFRQVIAKYGKPDVFYTEFVSADGLNSRGRDKLMIDLKFSRKEKPIVAQLFGHNPETIKSAATLCKKLGFDGIDLNMGCPEKNICHSGHGAAMIKNPKLAREVIRAAVDGASGLPVSVKTRLGYYKKEEMEVFLPAILQENLAAVAIHARTKKEMSKVPADWSSIKRAVEIRNEQGSQALIIGNGDVMNLEEARVRVKETGCDGVMIGRGIFGDPWLFNKKIKKENVSLKKQFKVMIKHTQLFEKYLLKDKKFDIMKKHFKAYVTGFDGAKELRMELMAAKNSKEIAKIIRNFQSNTKK